MKKPAAFLLTLIFFLSTTSNVFSTDLKLEPENFFIQATAGQTIRETVLIKNLFSSLKAVRLAWEGYNLPEGEFISRADLEKHSISFANLSQQAIELPPFGTGAIETEFKIPKDIAPADYYGSLSVRDQSSKTQTEFTIRILGKIEEKIDITSFSNEHSNLLIRIANNGNQTSNLLVKVIARDLLGQEVSLAPIKQQIKAAQQKNLNIEDANLLPGYYQAKISLEYGSGKTKTSFYSFWVHPEFFIIGGSLLIILVLSALRFRKRVRK